MASTPNIEGFVFLFFAEMTIKEHIKEFEEATGKSGTYSRAAEKFIKWMIANNYRKIKAKHLREYIDAGSFSKSYESITRKYCFYMGFDSTIPSFSGFRNIHKNSDKGEEWVKVVDAVDYMVSNFGRIKNLATGRILKVTASKKDRYCRISGNWNREKGFSKNRGTRTQHSIVFFSFNPELYPPTRDKHIDHIDRDPTNNRLDNLRYVTIVENMKNRFRISSNVIAEICEMYSNGHSVESIYDVLGKKYHLFSQRKTK